MVGFVYGLAAMGLTLIFGVMKVINLAHGPIMVVGMFATLILSQSLGINPYVGLIFVLLLGLGWGVLMYFVSVHPVLNAPERTTLLATFAVNLMLVGLGTVIFTTTPRALDVDLGAIRSGAITILGTKTVAVVIAVLFSIGLYLFLYETRLGKSIRAVANNRQAASLMGIDTTWVLALSFGIGIAIAMVSGTLLATLFSFTVISGSAYQIKSFVIVVLGGLGNPIGALLGGIVIGMLEGVFSMFLPVGWVPVIEFGVFVLILIARPRGLLGVR